LPTRVGIRSSCDFQGVLALFVRLEALKLIDQFLLASGFATEDGSVGIDRSGTGQK
jgi:hypothetical protein